MPENLIPEIPAALRDLCNGSERIIMSPNRRKIVGRNKRCIWLWDVKSQKQDAILPLNEEDNVNCASLVISDDNHFVIAWTHDNKNNNIITRWNIKKSFPEDIQTLRYVQQIKKKQSERLQGVFTIPRTNLFAFIYDNKLQIIDLCKNKQLYSWKISREEVTIPLIDGMMITSYPDKNPPSIKIWDLKSKGKCSASIDVPKVTEAKVPLSTRQKMIGMTVPISDKQFMLVGPFVRIYNIHPLECIVEEDIEGKDYMNRDIEDIYFRKLDEKHFISVSCDNVNSTSTQLNLWRLSNNDFKIVTSAEGFPINVDEKFKFNHIQFLPFQEENGVWLYSISGKELKSFSIPIDNNLILENDNKNSSPSYN